MVVEGFLRKPPLLLTTWFNISYRTPPDIHPINRGTKCPLLTDSATRSMVKAASKAPPPKAINRAVIFGRGVQKRAKKAPRGSDTALIIPKLKAFIDSGSIIHAFKLHAKNN